MDEKVAGDLIASDEAEGFFGVKEFDRAGHFVTTHIEYLFDFVEPTHYIGSRKLQIAYYLSSQ